MKEWIRIAGAWLAPGRTVTRPAIECDLPPRWLSKVRPPGPGPEVIFPTPILLRHKSGETERINWLPPRLHDRHIANADQIQVFEISEADWEPELGEIELLRLIKHGVARVALGEQNTSHRRGIIRTLHDREDLRELIAKRVFEGMAEAHQVLAPKQLGLLFGGAVSRETFQGDVRFARLAPLIELAEPVYEQVRDKHPELPIMRDFIRAMKRKKHGTTREEQDTFVSEVLKRIITYQDSETSQLNKLGDKLVEFVRGTNEPSGPTSGESP